MPFQVHTILVDSSSSLSIIKIQSFPLDVAKRQPGLCSFMRWIVWISEKSGCSIRDSMPCDHVVMRLRNECETESSVASSFKQTPNGVCTRPSLEAVVPEKAKDNTLSDDENRVVAGVEKKRHCIGWKNTILAKWIKPVCCSEWKRFCRLVKPGPNSCIVYHTFSATKRECYPCSAIWGLFPTPISPQPPPTTTTTNARTKILRGLPQQ